MWCTNLFFTFCENNNEENADIALHCLLVVVRTQIRILIKLQFTFKSLHFSHCLGKTHFIFRTALVMNLLRTMGRCLFEQPNSSTELLCRGFLVRPATRSWQLGDGDPSIELASVKFCACHSSMQYFKRLVTIIPFSFPLILSRHLATGW